MSPVTASTPEIMESSFAKNPGANSFLPETKTFSFFFFFFLVAVFL